MIDHSYKISTREVLATPSHIKHFIAELSHVFVIVDDKRIEPQHPTKEFSGATQITAIMKASDALFHWMKQQEFPQICKAKTL